MTGYVRTLRGRLDTNSPRLDLRPHLIWSESQWKNQKLRDVPNVVTGSWQFLRAYIR
ncbi:MAG TPA: hypothetical protein VGK88_02190 [bacterium]